MSATFFLNVGVSRMKSWFPAITNFRGALSPVSNRRLARNYSNCDPSVMTESVESFDTAIMNEKIQSLNLGVENDEVETG